MPVITAAPLVVSEEQRAELSRMAASSVLPHRQVVQARALLWAGDGVANEEIARRSGVDSDTVRRWRKRFIDKGTAGVGVIAKGRGRRSWLPPGTVEEVLRLTREELAAGGSTHWTSRGRAGTMTHDYKRNGTIDLFAAMNLTTGQVLTEFRKTHKGADVLRFFKQMDAAVPRGLSVHVVLDNLSAHRAPEVTKWLAHKDRRRWHLHFTPTSSSWLNLVERWFKELTEKRLRRGRVTNVADLTHALTLRGRHWEAHPKTLLLEETSQGKINQGPRR